MSTRLRRRRFAHIVSGLLTLSVLTSVVGINEGVPTASAATISSAVTIKASDPNQDADLATAPFPNLAVTVSATTNLQAQGITINWTGAAASTPPTSQVGGTNFLQIMQCWGDDPHDSHRPDRTTCQFGGFVTPSATRDDYRSSSVSIASQDADYTVPRAGSFQPAYTSIPFRSATGVTVSSIGTSNGVKQILPVNVNTNQFFTQYTSNEITWAGSADDGTGSAKFELQTAAQSPGLGCGNPVTATDGSVSGAACWLVVIPRGTSDAGLSNVSTSGLFWDSWKHSLAVKLKFKPLGARCAIGASERQLAGSELVAGAVASWQPAVCSTSGGSIYSLLTSSESDAALAANGSVTAPLALTSRPLTGATDNLRYAPIAITGVSIVFAIDRFPDLFSSSVPADVLSRARLPFTSLKLTPRLLAKLLTNSYVDSLPSGANKSHVGYISRSSPGKNAQNLTVDPDFLAINDPEWKYQTISSASLADLLVPQGRSDAAWAVWQYVIADPDAKAFLAGTPDPWGMVVNPWSSTDATKNLSGTAFAVPRDNFPKADPIELPAAGGNGPVNLVTWRPYTNDFDTSAYLTLRGDGQLIGAWDPNSSPARYAKSPRQLVGSQKVLGLTDTASASRYQVLSAALLNPAGQFVAPTADSMAAAAAVMVPTAQPQVVGFDPTSTAAKTAPAAYPLTVPVYAAVNPATSDSTVRASYAAFIRYASTTGQTQGSEIGQLPDGYTPLPDSWRAQAASAAAVIASGKVPTITTPGATASSTTSSSSPSESLTTLPLGQSASATGTQPDATGELAPKLAGATTPDDPGIGGLSSLLPLAILLSLAALVTARIAIRRRRVDSP